MAKPCMYDVFETDGQTTDYQDFMKLVEFFQ
jgi:hypothetical protein